MTQKKERDYRTTIGGQALIEGILMLGPQKAAIVVNTPQGHNVKEIQVTRLKDKYKILGLPFIRGVFSMYDSLRLGIGALTYSTDIIEEEEEKGRLELWLEKKFTKEKVEKALMGFALFLGVLLPIGLFILLPSILAGFLVNTVGTGFVRNLLEGLIRIIIFFIYLVAVSRIDEMKRVFAYHGAEHKAVYCYEAGDELTVDNVRKYPRQHPRCGTSFLFVVMIVSILVFSFVRLSNPILRMLLRIAFLPIVVGLSYEINRVVGRYDNVVTKVLRAPGMWLQNLTTREPDDSMIGVAIDALTRVIPENEGLDRW
ncbi:MAG: DUF1385 domain-containing protein [Clostridiales bacterium]|jgi:uncharacterized protein YqhQ|nr:DUF1385 domain-containing protein [Clostridiales bacterium]